MLPTAIIKLLLLWDELGIPHEEWKQIFSSPLAVIGFDVDPNLMKITLKEESKCNLVWEMRAFARFKSRRSLREFEHIAGLLNWVLNVCLLLHPGLLALYAKTKGKTNSKGLIWLNCNVITELLWATFHLECSNGVYLLKTVSWNFDPLPNNVLQVFCDASGSGMGYWFPELLLGFQSNLPLKSPVDNIFFHEALCMGLAIWDGITCLPLGGQLAVFTDSLNTIYLFNSLSGDPGYNHLLNDVVEVIMAFGIDF
jgi:hypothetical protein